MDFRKFAGQYPDMEAPNALPSIDQLVGELRLLREEGLGSVRSLELPALDQAARLVGLTTTAPAEPREIRALLVRGIEQLDDGGYSQAALCTFGLEGGSTRSSSTERRRRAAACIGRDGVTPDTFRKKHEKIILAYVAEEIYDLARIAQLGTNHLIWPDADASSTSTPFAGPRRAARPRLQRPVWWALGAAVVLAIITVGAALLVGRPSQAEQLEAAYDGKDPFNVTNNDCSGIARSQPALPVRPSVTGPDGTVVGTLELRTWPECRAAWGRVLWNDDPTAIYQIPAGWTLQVEVYRPTTETRQSFSEPSGVAPIEWAYGPMLATARGCVLAEAYFTDGTSETPRVRTACFER